MIETLTFRDYLRYLEAEIESKKSHISSQEEEIYASMRTDLEQAKNLPKYMLDAPLLASHASLDQNTIQAISEIKEKIRVAPPKSIPIFLSSNIYRELLFFFRKISLFLQENKQALIAATVGLIGLLIISSFLASIQLVDSGYVLEAGSLVGAAGVQENIQVVEGKYITNVGNVVFWLGVILLAALVITFRKK